MASLRSLQEFDANPDVLVLIAYDTAPLDVMKFLSHGTINDWRAKGRKENMHWHCVIELSINGLVARKPLVDRVYGSDGIKDHESRL